VLDEATSNVDVQTELVLLRDLFTLTSTRTVIFVTHRVATAAAADLVCVIDGGRLVGSGSHTLLIESCGVYRELFAAAQGGTEGMRLRSTRTPGLV
jgi:ATP-binding cassette subfamily B protein